MKEDNENEKLIEKEKKRVEKEEKKEQKKKKKEEKNLLKLEKTTPEQLMKNKKIVEFIYTVILVVVVLSVYVSINIITKTIDFSNIDLTSQKFYSLSKESKEELKNIDKEVTIYIFGYTENTGMVDLAKQYERYKDNIKIELVTLEDRPDLVQEYNITTEEQNKGLVLLTCEGRSIKASYNDFYTYDYNTYEYIDLTEQKLTNSILAVTLEKSPKMYFLTGHSEYTTANYLTILGNELKSEINTIENLDLLVTNQIPEDCETLIIYNPSTDFTDFETDLIIAYINKGGNILWLSDYSINGKLPNRQRILDLYGLDVSNDGFVIEQDPSAMLMQTQDVIIPRVNTSAEITKDIASSGKVVLFASGKLDLKTEEEIVERGVIITELLRSSDKAFYRTDLSRNSAAPVEGEEVKEYTLGALAEKTIKLNPEDENSDTVTSKLVIYANAIFGTDQPIAIQNQGIALINLYNNKDLIMNSISYLTERKETITLRKTVTEVPYSATEQENLIVRLIVFIAPLIIIVIGFVVWIKRRHRK